MTRDSSDPISEIAESGFEEIEVFGASMRTETTQSRQAISRITQLSQSMIMASR